MRPSAPKNALVHWTDCTLGALRIDQARSLDPRKSPKQRFELYSIPSFPTGTPETVLGAEVGSSKQTVAPGTVLVSKINPRINRVWVVGTHTPHPKIASTEWIPFFPHPAVAPRFLRYFLSQDAFRNYLAANVSGVGGSLMRVRPAVLEPYPIALPPLPEQHRIVAAIETQLTRLDAAIASLKRVQANLKRYRASVLKAAVEGRLVPTEAELARREGREYEPASVLLERILKERRRRWEESELAKMKAMGKSPNDDRWKERYEEPNAPDTSDLPELPEGWCWATMPQLGELNRGKSKHRPRNDPRLLGGRYPFVQTGDIRKAGGFITTYEHTYSEHGLAQSRLWPAGTLCITIAANIAETGILSLDACFPDSIVGFLHDGNPITVRFIEFSLRTARESLERYAPATAQKNINLQTLSCLAIPVPPVAEQVRIVGETDRLLSLATEAGRDSHGSLARCQHLRQAILKWAFEGKLVDQDPNEEPGSVLLERIKTERESAKKAGAAVRAPRPARRRPRKR